MKKKPYTFADTRTDEYAFMRLLMLGYDISEYRKTINMMKDYSSSLYFPEQILLWDKGFYSVYIVNEKKSFNMSIVHFAKMTVCTVIPTKNYSKKALETIDEIFECDRTSKAANIVATPEGNTDYSFKDMLFGVAATRYTFGSENDAKRFGNKMIKAINFN